MIATKPPIVAGLRGNVLVGGVERGVISGPIVGCKGGQEIGSNDERVECLRRNHSGAILGGRGFKRPSGNGGLKSRSPSGEVNAATSSGVPMVIPRTLCITSFE